MNKKIISLLIIFVLLATNLAAAANPLRVAGGWAKGKATGLSRRAWRSGALLSKDVRDIGVSVFLLIMAFSMLLSATTDLSNNITSHILQNPPVYSEGFRSMIGFFISLIQPFYILAIILTAFYIMFVSDSYVRRSKAKAMLGKLVVGLIITSFSLPVLWTFFSMSEAVTSSILNQGMVDRAIEEYNHAMWNSYNILIYSLVLGNAAKVSRFLKALPYDVKWYGQLPDGSPIGSPPKAWVSKWKNFFKVVKMKGDFGRSTPFLMFFTVLFAGLYTLISLRYVMVMIWALLFPLMVFFLSFDMTRRLGRTMLEQTVLFTILQVFYAVCFTAVGAALTILPPEMYGTYVITYHGVGEAAFKGLIEFGAFTGVACMVLYLGPVVLFNLFQKLFPP